MPAAPASAAFEVGHIAQAGGRMGMHINRQLDVFAQRRDKVVAFLRRHDARHILDAERIAAKRFDLLAQGDEHLQIVNRAEACSRYSPAHGRPP